MGDRKQEKHESFGKISFSRYNCNFDSFFGTDITSSGGISIKIKNASKERSLDRDYIYGFATPVVEVKMSYNQFYDAIGVMMNTDGVPCTFVSKNGEYIEPIEHSETKQETFQREFEGDIKKIGRELNEITKKMNNMSKGKTIKKTEFKELIHDVQQAKQKIESNLPFVLKQFGIRLNKSMTEAKNGFVGFLEQKVFSLGLEQIKKEDIDNMIGFKKGEK